MSPYEIVLDGEKVVSRDYLREEKGDTCQYRIRIGKWCDLWEIPIDISLTQSIIIFHLERQGKIDWSVLKYFIGLLRAAISPSIRSMSRWHASGFLLSF